MTPTQKMQLLFAACAMAVTGYIAREGWQTTAYPDPVVGKKLPTICAGDTSNVRMGQTETEAGCIQRTMLVLVNHSAPILPCIQHDMPVPFLSEMVALSPNIGVNGFLGSSMCAQMKVGNYPAACDAILEWHKAGGVDCRDPNQKVCRGLWIDRQRQYGRCYAALGLTPPRTF